MSGILRAGSEGRVGSAAGLHPPCSSPAAARELSAGWDGLVRYGTAGCAMLEANRDWGTGASSIPKCSALGPSARGCPRREPTRCLEPITLGRTCLQSACLARQPPPARAKPRAGPSAPAACCFPPLG